jgi:nitroreductase
MDALECIKGRRETREFLDRPVPEEVVRQVLEAGRLAGSAKNRQPWDFILIQDRERLHQLSRFGDYATHLAEAAFAVVIARRDEYQQDAFDTGRAAQNMLLAAHALGLGGCPITLHKGEEARRFLGVPEDRVIQVCLAFGYPRPVVRRGRVRRRPLEDVVHLERW